MIIKYIVIDRGGAEFIPVAEADGVEIYRGGIHPSPIGAFHAACNCRQVALVMDGEDPREVAK